MLKVIVTIILMLPVGLFGVTQVASAQTASTGAADSCTPPEPGSTAAKAPEQQSGGLKKLWKAAQDSTKQGLGISQSGPKSVDLYCLRNILPKSYDAYQPLSKQFPHVAVTVLKSPPKWGDAAMDRSQHYANACWTLRAVVWSDEQHSKVIGPFDWCTPRDSEIQPMATVGITPAAIDVVSHYRTGTTRTEGPRPPNTLVPDDRATEELAAENTSPDNGKRLALKDLNDDGYSRFGHMFYNLRYQMGSTFKAGDYRVWIVSIQ
jgi:hypothetical protein